VHEERLGERVSDSDDNLAIRRDADRWPWDLERPAFLGKRGDAEEGTVRSFRLPPTAIGNESYSHDAI
jgi:hypothetical protein